MDRRTLIGEAARVLPGIDGYEPSTGYSTPVAKVTARPGNFWSGMDPVQIISRAGEKAPEAFAEIAVEVTERAHKHASSEGIEVPDFCYSQVVGTMELMWPRVGVGAFGEARYIEMLENAGETVCTPEPGDENNGIDVRTDRATYQVKTTSRNPLEDDTFEDLIVEADHLIWVKPDGEIVELTE